MLKRLLTFSLVTLTLFADVTRAFADSDSDWLTLAPAADHPPLLLDDDNEQAAPSSRPSDANPAPSPFFFGLLDHRSSYGKNFFHDSLIGPGFDAQHQIELDYLHGERRHVQDDEVDAAFQWTVVGELSLAGEFGYSAQHQVSLHSGVGTHRGASDNARGFQNVDLAAYHPIFQFVSRDGAFDYTAVARMDVGIPTRTLALGKDAQLTPFVGQLLRVGRHVSAQAWTGSQFTLEPNPKNLFIYGVSLGYEIDGQQLALPCTDSLAPIIEIDGQSPYSSHRQDSLLGVGGFELTFASPSSVQPSIELGYEFPLDQGARQQLQWGVIAEAKLSF